MLLPSSGEKNTSLKVGELLNKFIKMLKMSKYRSKRMLVSFISN